MFVKDAVGKLQNWHESGVGLCLIAQILKFKVSIKIKITLPELLYLPFPIFQI